MLFSTIYGYNNKISNLLKLFKEFVWIFLANLSGSFLVNFLGEE